MADTVEKVHTVEASLSFAEAASISGEKTESTTVEKKKWGDVEDDDEKEAKNAVLELNSLSIFEEEEKRESVLEEPEDANIKANMEVLQKMGKFTGITAEVAVPEANRGVTAARRAPVSAQVVIGTSVTLKKWMAHKKLGLNHLKILFLMRLSICLLRMVLGMIP